MNKTRTGSCAEHILKEPVFYKAPLENFEVELVQSAVDCAMECMGTHWMQRRRHWHNYRFSLGVEASFDCCAHRFSFKNLWRVGLDKCLFSTWRGLAAGMQGGEEGSGGELMWGWGDWCFVRRSWRSCLFRSVGMPPRLVLLTQGERRHTPYNAHRVHSHTYTCTQDPFLSLE